ncbi:hypothetical protein LTR62_003587 [Meristemomyces frigidus]|uniref:Uncharacterized protein n=1 Tax=Meristemomyces frigidus TaxID=1508187 RepID=A0AAN7TP69_9PEZI|nr:hypothetical protein LTR62_003587 [Meristemomyces frigidus]
MPPGTALGILITLFPDFSTYTKQSVPLCGCLLQRLEFIKKAFAERPAMQSHNDNAAVARAAEVQNHKWVRERLGVIPDLAAQFSESACNGGGNVGSAWEM